MDKYAFVTGGSDRIGKAISIELAKQGYNVIIHYNSSQSKAEEVKEEIISLGRSAEILKINFLEDHDFDMTFQSLKTSGKEIDVLINCASDFTLSTIKDVGSQLLKKEYRINFEIPYLLTKAFATIYKKGHIINFLDTKVEKNATNRLDYILSKKSLKDFTLISAVELSPNIKVNAIAPGLVLPPAGKNDNYLLNLAPEIPMKTIGNMEDILIAFRYLLESNFVTGQILYVDGGDHLI
ncbi:MAG: SDR family oxidoreductase [Brumimicrobium sp.]